MPDFSIPVLARNRQAAAAALALCVVGAGLALSASLHWAGFALCAAAALMTGWIAFAPPTGAPGAVPAAPEPAGESALDQFAALLEAMPDPALLIDAQGRIAAANAGGRRMLGFTTAGLRLEAVLRRPELLDAAHAASHDGATLAVDYEITAPVEEHFRVHFAPVALPGQTAALMVFYDQTTTINTERMRADFLANASHELRTPLASMTLLLETLSGHARDDPSAQQRFFKLMHAQADRMRDLINDLLSLSKIELNEHVPPGGEVDLAPMARQALDVLSPLAQKSGVTVTLRTETDSARVVGDRSQLMQVLQNLVDNAIKYSPPGGEVVVELGLGEDREEAAARAGRQWPEASRISLLSPPPAAGRRFAYLRVSDSGPGVARRYLPRLSERFFRVEREESSDRAGTGLGLAIVKHIVNRHRGGFIVESLPGKGSAFAVYIERPVHADTPKVLGASAATPAG